MGEGPAEVADVDDERAADEHAPVVAEPARPAARPGSWRSGVPWKVALVAVLVATGFVLLRWQAAADGDIGAFVYLGEVYADDARPPDIPQVEGTGYDGQFFWRFGNDPFDHETRAHEGVQLDNHFRSQRLGYPVLAWILTAGGRGPVDLALVVVNVLALGALAFLGALEARRVGRTGWFGLSVASVPAFVYSLSRDLSEPLACSLLLAALLALRRERWGWATAAFSVAVLTREQLVVVVGVYGLFRLWTLLKERAAPTAADLPWAVPAVCFVTLQVVIWSLVDAVPLQESGGSNSTLPFTDLVPVVGDWTAWLPGLSWPKVNGIPWPVLFEQVRALPELALMAVLVVVAVTTRIQPEQRRWERWAVVVVALLAVSLGRVVYENPADLRTIADLAILSWAVALAGASKRTLTAIAIATPVVALPPFFALVYLP
jgi:hypothetical protein